MTTLKDENSMNRFQIYRDTAGYYRWRLVARNSEKVAASEAYVSKQGAIRSAERVRELARIAVIVDTILTMR